MTKKLTFAFLLATFVTAALGDMTDDEQTHVLQAKRFFIDRLKDPDSAQFRNLVVRKIFKDNGTVLYNVCGEINAKNSFGGYVGFRPFYFSGDWGEVLGENNIEAFKLIYTEVVCTTPLPE